jgi:hypothetical protein
VGRTGAEALVAAIRCLELAELGIAVRLIWDTAVVRAEQGPVGMSQPAVSKVRICGADDQCLSQPGVARTELQGHLPPVAPPSHHRLLQSQRGDQAPMSSAITA